MAANLLFYKLIPTAGDGDGVGVDTSAAGKNKTIQVEGDFSGAVNIEISLDNQVSWVTIATFLNPDKQIIPVAAQFMRVRRSGVPAINPGLPDIQVSTNDTGAMFAVIPAAPGMVDTSKLGNFRTVTVVSTKRPLNIEISDDGVNWATCMTFVNEDLQSAKFTSRWMRSTKGAIIAVGAINEGSGIDTDILVKTTALDTTAEYLDDKIVVVGNISKAVIDKGGGVLAEELTVPFPPPPTPLCDETPEDVVFDESGPGQSDEASRCDHSHHIDSGDPVTVRGPTNASGSDQAVALADHEHRLEYEVEDEGVLVSARPRTDYVGDGVGAVDVPGEDLTRVTIPGPNLGDGGAVVKRSTYVATPTSTSSFVYVDGMSGGSVTVPIDGSYWVMFEGEGENQSNGIQVEIGISINSVVAVVAASERATEGNSSDMRPLVTTVQLPGLTAGDLIRCLYKRVGGGGVQMVAMERRHLTIIKVQ